MAPRGLSPLLGGLQFAIATKKNKKARTLEISEVCSICGNGTENKFCAVVEWFNRDLC